MKRPGFAPLARFASFASFASFAPLASFASFAPQATVAASVTGMLGLALLAAASGGPPKSKAASAAPGGSTDQSHWPADDRSLCEGAVHWRNNPQLEVTETAGPGSIRPNIRRVYKVLGERDSRHQVIICREIDTNLDGLKDVVRTFNEKEEPLHEEADTNYDGIIDDWVNFAGGRIEEEDIDTTLSAGRPNVWKFYLDGQLSRIRRNTHCPSGKPDVWEIYVKDRVERVGNDTTCDGHVDRWDRDTELMAQEEAANGVQVAEGGAPAAPSATGGDGTNPTTVDTAGNVTDGGPPTAKKAAKKKGNK